MPVNGANFDPRLTALYRDGREVLGDAEWFDAHTHIGQNDPDGRTATPEEIIGGLAYAGRGIPHLGEAVVDLARTYPGARLILAHAGISDLGWIARDAAELPNLLFDTAWWLVADHLQLYATIPPGQILYASDMPYGPGLFTAFVFLRSSMTVALPSEVRR